MGDKFDYFNDMFNEEFPENQNTKIKTEEELKKLSTKEGITNLEKAMHILVNGYELQKKSLIQNLARYLKEDGANDKLIPIILNSVEEWGMNFQIEGAKAFVECNNSSLIMQRHGDQLMKLTGSLIQQNIESAIEESTQSEESDLTKLFNSWMEVFISLGGLISIEGLKNDALPFIKELVDLGKPTGYKKYGVTLLVSLALKYDEDLIIKGFKVLLRYCCQDYNWTIRLKVCEALPKLGSKLSKENGMDIIYPEIVVLLTDVEILVSVLAIETVLEIFDLLDNHQIDTDFIPAVKNHLKFDIDEGGLEGMSRCFGKIVFHMQNRIEDSTGINSLCLDYFKQLTEIETVAIKINIGYNLPGLYYVYGSHEEIDFVSLLYKYSMDKESEVRMQFAKGFHEIVSINSKGKGDALELKEMFFNLLCDEEVDIQNIIMDNLDEYLHNFFRSDFGDLSPKSKESAGTDDSAERAKADFFEEVVDHLVKVDEAYTEKKSASWRVKITFYEKLTSGFELFAQDTLKDAFYDKAKELFKTGAEPLQRTGATFCAKVIYGEGLGEYRQQMFDELVNSLKEGTSAQRKLLLMFYERSLEVFSKKFWKHHGLPGFLDFVRDPIPIIRIRYAKSAQIVWSSLTEFDTDINFDESIDTLLEDPLEDVQEAGLSLNRGVIKGYDKTRESELEEEEKRRLSFEEHLKEREKRERDEIQRKKDEEKEKKEYMEMLTGHKVKKRFSKLGTSSKSLLSKDGTNNKGRSRKRGSFLIGSRSKTSKFKSGKKNSTLSASSTSKNRISTPNNNTRSLTLTSKDKKSGS